MPAARAIAWGSFMFPSHCFFHTCDCLLFFGLFLFDGWFVFYCISLFFDDCCCFATCSSLLSTPLRLVNYLQILISSNNNFRNYIFHYYSIITAYKNLRFSISILNCKQAQNFKQRLYYIGIHIHMVPTETNVHYNFEKKKLLPLSCRDSWKKFHGRK